MAFTPTVAQTRLLALMNQRPDWCVSRQRTWGVPMALVLDRSTGQPHAQAAQVMRRVADAVQSQGVEVWWNTPMVHWLPSNVQEADVVVVHDVLDVWFDSGALGVHAGPADLVVEGHDQLRGWFQACVWLAALLNRPTPFRRVVTHGFVVGDRGEKLSKSEGGDRASADKSAVPSWATLPVDVLRWWALLGDTGADRPWTLTTVQAAQAAYAKARGTLRFALANVPQEAWGQPFHWEGASALDLQSVQEARTTEATVLAAMEQGAYEAGARRLLTWMDEGLSRNLYVRLKDRLYCAPLASPTRQAAVATLRAVGEVLVRLLGVVNPDLMAEASAHLPVWPVGDRHPLPTFTPWPSTLDDVQKVLHQAWEGLGQKGGLDRARLVLDVPQDHPQWAVEEALGVGQWQPQGAAEGVPVTTPWGTGWLQASPDPLCPRCRRPAPLLDDGLCGPCTQAHPHALLWR